MTSDLLPPFVRHLLNPASYPHDVEEVKLVQTHISYVLLAGDFVYKFKKPVDFGFLDFTTLAKRCHYCEQELLLNRRLCPSIYRGLVRVEEVDGALVLQEAAGKVDDRGVREYGVKMVRMPEERMMANLIRQGGLTPAMIDAICDTLIPFYQRAASGPEIQRFGTAEAVSVNVLENFAQTEGFVGQGALEQEQFERLNRYATEFLSQRDLFADRIAAGRIRDCHGDLYSANICLADQVHIYDCIEFNQRFRYCDVTSDVAFLAMDLDFHGLTDLSTRFIERFRQLSGDDTMMEVLNFYKCYRAYVRGKIGLFTAHAPEVDQESRTHALAQAKKYFRLAESYGGH